MAAFPGGHDDVLIGVIVGGGKAPKIIRRLVGYGDEVSSKRITRVEEIVDQGGNTVKRKFVSSQDDLLNEGMERMGDLNDWTERKPDFWRKKDGSMEIEISPGHQSTGEPPHIKVLKFDPNKGKKGGMRVIEKIFVEE